MVKVYVTRYVNKHIPCNALRLWSAQDKFVATFKVRTCSRLKTCGPTWIWYLLKESIFRQQKINTRISSVSWPGQVSRVKTKPDLQKQDNRLLGLIEAVLEHVEPASHLVGTVVSFSLGLIFRCKTKQLSSNYNTSLIRWVWERSGVINCRIPVK